MTSASRTNARAVLPLIACIASAGLFGASTPASKALLGTLHPILLAGVLYAGAALAVAPFAFDGWREVRAADTRNRLLLLGAVLCGGVIGPVLLLVGLSLTTASSVALWLNLEGVATALLARAFFEEHLHAATWIAVALVVAASALLAGASPAGGLASVFVALACLAWGADNNFTAVIDRFTPAQITFVKGAVAGALNTAVGLQFSNAAPSAASVCAGLGVGALSYGASLVLYVAGAQQLGATRSQLVFSTAPAFGVAGSWLVLGESISAAQAVAFVLMAAAVWSWHRERHEHRHRHERIAHVHWHRHDDGHHDHAHGAKVPSGMWHSHEHVHGPIEHAHGHRPDLHHRHRH